MGTRLFALALTVLVVSLGLPTAARALVVRADSVAACYDPVQNRPTTPPPDPDRWCQPVFSDLQVQALDGGVRVSWKPLGGSVPWSCGPGGTIVSCAITGVRVASYYVIPNVGVAGQARCATSLDTQECTIGGLEPGRTYKVEVYVDLANGNWLRVNSSVTPCCRVPASPVDVVATPVGGALDVTWGQSPDWGGADELAYRVSTSPATSGCEVTALACRVDGVVREVPITVTVTATNKAGTSQPVTAAPVTVPVTIPDPPGRVTARYPRSGTARVSWTAPADDGGERVTRYIVRASPGAATCETSGALSCTIRGLAGGRTYAFTVQAVNGIGTSEPSPVGVAGLLVNPASAPREVRATATGGTAAVSWTRPAESGGGRLLQYVVRAGSSTCTTKKTSCAITGLALGRTYPVSVIAVTTGGRSRPAATTVTTVAPAARPPSAPVSKPTAQVT